MVRNRLNYIVYLLAIAGLFWSCGKDVVIQKDSVLDQYLNLPKTAYSYDLNVPDAQDDNFLRAQENLPQNLHITDDIATLGRVLFYDKSLSINGSISCASCHKQEFGFSDTAFRSSGHSGGKTRRHAMRITYARYRPTGVFFWDARAKTLEDQVLMPFLDSLEMGLSMEELIAKVQKQPYYSILFQNAFQSDSVTSTKIAASLAQFIRAMAWFDSKYDLGRSSHEQNESFSNFTDQENFGKSLFFNAQKGNCGGCHASEAFNMDVPRNNGLPSESQTSTDKGYEEVTGNALDRNKFIAPSLRNVSIAGPYMHDGRFNTLDEVIEHYNSHIQYSESLDNHLKASEPNQAVRLNLTETEKQAIVAFLETLIDEKMKNDIRFSDPFK